MSPSASAWLGEERRRTLRHDLAAGVSCRLLEDARPPVAVQSEDVSLGGLLVVSRREFPVGARIEVVLREPDGTAGATLRGVVKRCERADPAGAFQVGIEFDPSECDQAAELLRLAGADPPREQERRYTRVRSAVRMAFRRSRFGRWRRTTALDVSVGGLMFESGEPMLPGDRLAVRLRLKEVGTVRLRGEVVGVSRPEGEGPARVHLRFLEPGPRARERLARYVARRAGAEGERPLRAARRLLLSLLGRAALAASVAVPVAVFALLAKDWSPFAILQGGLYDLNFRLRGARPPRTAITLVAMDDETLARLGEWGATFPRTADADARVLERLKAWGARAVAFDRLTVPEPSDAALLAEGDPAHVVWGAQLRRLSALPEPLRGAFRWGFSNMTPDLDMRVRRAPLAARGHPSLGLAVAELVARRPLASGNPSRASVLINYRGPAGTYPAVPYWRVAEGRVDPERARALFGGRIVLVGVTSPGVRQVHPTPFTTLARLGSSTVEIHANVVDNLLAGDALRRAPGWLGALVTAGAAFLVALVFLWAPPWQAVLLFPAVLAVLVVSPVWVVSACNVVLDQVAPVLAVALSAVLSLGIGATVATREKRLMAAQRDVLEAEQAAQRENLRRARSIVEALLPDLRRLPFAGRLEVGASFRPAERVGGDIYDIWRIGPNRAAVIFADVSGHGISAALVAAMIKSAATFLSEHAADAARFLTRLNNDLCHMLPDDMFAAVFYAVIDLKRGTLAYANGGHRPLPALCRAGGEPPRVLDEAGGLVAGALEEYPYEAATVPFAPGDCLILCSDGISEGRCEREDGAPLPDDLLRLAALPDLTAEHLARRIVAWAEHTPREDVSDDDETILVIRRA